MMCVMFFKGTVMEEADEVVGWRESRVGEKKGNEWWKIKLRMQ